MYVNPRASWQTRKCNERRAYICKKEGEGISNNIINGTARSLWYIFAGATTVKMVPG